MWVDKVIAAMMKKNKSAQPNTDDYPDAVDLEPTKPTRPKEGDIVAFAS